ncbi:hypothetical protein [Pusillimonas sp.]|uniref:hypothetical protein n=1 Tax=Pusillimonas sp. TaxID=3040095 RepID=UPI0029A42180|nr:hypothetical protein [Pusillimonas sp.]MDX3895332.1 hypothetical protein [Pusillimonas sp.]
MKTERAIVPAKYYKSVSLLLFSLAITFLIYQVSVYSIFTVDDAFITWRYGRSFVDSGFWNYNPSTFELSEAYTNPLIAFLSIIPAFLSLDVVSFFKVFALLIHLIYFFRLYTILGPWYFIPTAIILVSPGFILHNYSGLETTIFGFLVFELFYQAYRERPGGVFSSSLLLIFIRPEGVLFPMCVLAYSIIIRNKNVFFLTLLSLFPFLFYIVFRLAYFGLPLPNTFYVKSGTVFSFDRFQSYFFYILPAIICILVHQGKKKWLSASFLTSFIVIAILYSKSNLMMDYLDRFSWHLMLPALLIGSFMLSRRAAGVRDEKLFGYCLVIVSIAFSLYLYQRDIQKNQGQIQHILSYYPRAINAHMALGKAISRSENENLIFVFGDAGMAAYQSRRNAIDNIGLASRTVASGDFSLKYLDEVRPDIVIFHSDPTKGGPLLRNHNQAVMMSYVDKNGLQHLCDIYWTGTYYLAVYVTDKTKKDEIENFIPLCMRSKSANNVNNFLFLQSLEGYPFYKFWADNVDEFKGADEIFVRAKEEKLIFQSKFEVRIGQDRIYFYSDNCAEDSLASKFFLHFVPKDTSLLKPGEVTHGFKNLDFYFSENGIVSDGRCVAVQKLPGEAASLKFGQFKPSGERVWEGAYQS